MKTLYRTWNTAKIGTLIVASGAEEIEQISFKAGRIKKSSSLQFRSAMNDFPQYSKSALDEVCREAPSGVAHVKHMGDGRYQWVVVDQDTHKHWEGQTYQFVR